MKRFKNILLATDGTPGAALERAAALARANKARLSVASVLEPVPALFDRLTDSLSAAQVQKALESERRQMLQDLIKPLKGSGLRMSVKVLVGSPFVELIREVIRGPHDLLIKAAQGRSGPAALLFGSTDLHLLRKCPCPVWMVKPRATAAYRRVLAAVDPLAENESAAGLDADVMTLASSLAAREDAELHVVHAWTLYGESVLRHGRAQLPKPEVDRMLAQARSLHRARVDALLAPHEEPAAGRQVHLLKGEPAEVIGNVATRIGADVIVMGTVARTGIPGVFIGNTAERVLAAANCSVLAIKPAGFLSPVEP